MITFSVNDDAPSEHSLVYMRATLLDATAGSEDAHFEINVDVAGTNTERLSLMQLKLYLTKALQT